MRTSLKEETFQALLLLFHEFEGKEERRISDKLLKAKENVTRRKSEEVLEIEVPDPTNSPNGEQAQCITDFYIKKA